MAGLIPIHRLVAATCITRHGDTAGWTMSIVLQTMIAPELLTAGGKYSVNRQKL